jgi:hypothetical protein
MLVNSSNPQSRSALTDVQTAAAAMGQPLDIFAVTTNREISQAFADAARMGADALLISPDPMFASRSVQLATLAGRHAMLVVVCQRRCDATRAGPPRRPLRAMDVSCCAAATACYTPVNYMGL